MTYVHIYVMAIRITRCSAGFGNHVERNFLLLIKSKQIEHAQFVSTLSKKRNEISFEKIAFTFVTEINVIASFCASNLQIKFRYLLF